MSAPTQTLPITPVLIIARRIGFVILSAMFVVAASVAIRERGPWYDEFYSFYLVRPDVPLSALWPAWLRDNHPPLFYALAWGWSRTIAAAGAGAGMTGTVEGLRTFNLVVLAVLAFAFVRLARTDRWFARIVWYDCLALAATFPALDRIDQLRSYCLSFAFTALLLPLLARQIRGDGGRRQTLLLGGVLALACSVHLVTTVILAGLVAATVAQRLIVRAWGDAWRLIVIATLALVPFAVMMVVQLHTIVSNTQVFWIPGGLNAARWAIEAETTNALGADPLLALVALAGLATLLVGARRGDPLARETLRIAATFAGGLALALIVLIAAHLQRPLLITRYLIALDPVLALIVALGVDAATARLPAKAVVVLDALLLVVTGFVLHANLAQTLALPSWDGTGAVIAQQVRACPGTTVHPDMRWNTMPLDSPPRDNRDIVPFSYRFVAHRFGFALAPPGPRSLSAHCPNLFWTEHVSDKHPTARTVIDGLHASGYPIRSGRMVRVPIGWVLITPPR